MKYKIFIFFIIITFLSACSKDESISDNDNLAVNKVLNRQSTGSSANDLLSDNTFKSMVIELAYVEGFEPNQTTINNFVAILNERTYKPNGITVEKRVILSPSQDEYTIEDIANIEREQRTKFNTNNQIAVWAVFIDGQSDKNSESNVILGTAYWNTSFVIYQETVQELSNSFFEPKRETLEILVITHELGLTNLRSPMQTEHEDEEHSKHCDVLSCLMYWTAESGIGLSNKNSIHQLDTQCLADLKANGGK